MIRDRRLMVALVAVAVLAGVVAAAGLLLTPRPPVPVVARDVPVGPDRVLTVQFVGDTYVGDQIQRQIEGGRAGYDWPFDGVRAMTASADFAVGNAEGPIGPVTMPWNPGKTFSHSSRPEAAGALARAGLDAMSLANNHGFDTGPPGLTDTIAHLDAVGVASFGGGATVVDAEQPLLLRTELGTIGIVGHGESYGHRATSDTGGTVELSRQSVQRSAALARLGGADWVVGYVHWGENYGAVDGTQRRWAAEFAAAGYDLVVGAGPHVSQPIEFVGDMPVVYSLGNFVFGYRGGFARHQVPGLGLVAELQLSGTAAPRLALRCLATDNLLVAYQARPCETAQAQAYLPGLHPQLRVDGEVGVLPCPGCFPRRAAPP